MDAIEIEDSLNINNQNQYNCKLYECKNFQFPFIEILNKNLSIKISYQFIKKLLEILNI